MPEYILQNRVSSLMERPAPLTASVFKSIVKTSVAQRASFRNTMGAAVQLSTSYSTKSADRRVPETEALASAAGSIEIYSEGGDESPKW